MSEASDLRRMTMVTIECGERTVTGETILDALDNARIFNVSREQERPARFRIEESCDNHFAAVLTREQLLALADELRAMADS